MAIEERIILKTKSYDIQNSINPGEINFEKTSDGKLGIYLGKVDSSEFFSIEKEDIEQILLILFKA